MAPNNIVGKYILPIVIYIWKSIITQLYCSRNIWKIFSCMHLYDGCFLCCKGSVYQLAVKLGKLHRCSFTNKTTLSLQHSISYDMPSNEQDISHCPYLAQAIQTECMVARQHLWQFVFVVVGLATDETFKERLLKTLLIKDEVPSPLFV